MGERIWYLRGYSLLRRIHAAVKRNRSAIVRACKFSAHQARARQEPQRAALIPANPAEITTEYLLFNEKYEGMPNAHYGGMDTHRVNELPDEPLSAIAAGLPERRLRDEIGQLSCDELALVLVAWQGAGKGSADVTLRPAQPETDQVPAARDHSVRNPGLHLALIRPRIYDEHPSFGLL